MKELYYKLLNKDDDKLSDIIDSMSHGDRVKLRKELENDGCNQLARNLYYDYDKQTWIE